MIYLDESKKNYLFKDTGDFNLRLTQAQLTFFRQM